MANMLVSLSSYQWWTFWTYLVTVSLFSLYMMNLFHTILDAVSNILRVHYKSKKCDVSFSQGSVNTLFTWGEHVLHMCKNVLPAYSSAKIIKIKRRFPELWSQMYCHVFYESQWIYNGLVRGRQCHKLYSRKNLQLVKYFKILWQWLCKLVLSTESSKLLLTWHQKLNSRLVE